MHLIHRGDYLSCSMGDETTEDPDSYHELACLLIDWTSMDLLWLVAGRLAGWVSPVGWLAWLASTSPPWVPYFMHAPAFSSL